MSEAPFRTSNGPRGDETEIGQSWQGDDGKEAAEDVCDLMNMAFDAGRESVK